MKTNNPAGERITFSFKELKLREGKDFFDIIFTEPITFRGQEHPSLTLFPIVKNDKKQENFFQDFLEKGKKYEFVSEEEDQEDHLGFFVRGWVLFWHGDNFKIKLLAENESQEESSTSQQPESERIIFTVDRIRNDSNYFQIFFAKIIDYRGRKVGGVIVYKSQLGEHWTGLEKNFYQEDQRFAIGVKGGSLELEEAKSSPDLFYLRVAQKKILEIKELVAETTLEQSTGEGESPNNQTDTTSTNQNSKLEPIIFTFQRLDSYPDFLDLILAEEIEYQGRKIKTISISKSQIENDLITEIKKLEKKKKYEIVFSEIELKVSGGLSEKGYLIIKRIISLKKALDKGKDKEKTTIEEAVSGVSNSNHHETAENEETKWQEIEPLFTRETITQWKKHGFSLEQTKDWVAAGLKRSDFDLAAWLRQKNYIPHWVLHYGNLTELRKQYQNSLRTNQTTAQEGEERVFDLTKIEKTSQEIFSDLHSLLEQNSISNERITNLQTHDFFTMVQESRKSYLEKEQEFSEQVEKTHKLLESLKNMPSPTFLNSLFPNWRSEYYIKKIEESFAKLEFSGSVMARVLLNSRVESNDIFNRVVCESLNYGKPAEIILQRLQTRYSQEKNELDRLIEVGKKTLELKDKELENKEQEISTIKREGENVLKQKESEKQKLKTELASKEHELEGTKTQKENLEKESKQLVVVYAKKVKDLEAENTNREIEIKNLSKKSTTLTSQLSSTQQNLKSAESTKNSLEMQVFNLKNEKEQLQNQISYYRLVLTQNQTEISARELIILNYQRKAQAVQQTINKGFLLFSPDEVAKAERDRLAEEYSKLQKEYHKFLIVNGELEVRNEGLAKTVRAKDRELEAWADSYQILEEEKKAIQDQLQSKQTRLQELTTNYRSLREEKESLAEELTTKKESYWELESELQKVNTSLNKTQKELSDWKRKFSALENEKETLNEELIQEKARLEETKQSLENLQMLDDLPPVPQSEPKWQQKLLARVTKLTGNKILSENISQAGENSKSLNPEPEVKNTELETQESRIMKNPPVSKPQVNKKLFWFIFILISFALILGIWKIGEIMEETFKQLVSLTKRKPKKQ